MHEPRSLPDNARFVVGVETFPTVRKNRHDGEYRAEVVISLRSVEAAVPGSDVREVFYVIDTNVIDSFLNIVDEARHEAASLAESYPRAYGVHDG